MNCHLKLNFHLLIDTKFSSKEVIVTKTPTVYENASFPRMAKLYYYLEQVFVIPIGEK